MRPVFFCRSCFFDLLDELKEWMTSNRLGTYVVQFADLGIRMMEDLADFEVIDNKCARVLDFDSILPFYLSFSLSFPPYLSFSCLFPIRVHVLGRRSSVFEPGPLGPATIPERTEYTQGWIDHAQEGRPSMLDKRRSNWAINHAKGKVGKCASHSWGNIHYSVGGASYMLH
jgi:hypothetical protein